MDKSKLLTRQALRADVTGQVCAMVEGEMLRKSVSAAKHFLRKPPAICFDEGILATAQSFGARYVEVTDRDSGRVFRANLCDFDRYGFGFDRGFGKQRALPLARWQVQQPGEPRQLRLEGA